MTNEEAIKGLKKLRTFHNGSYGEHIDMAIKALEAQPCIEDYPTCTECEHYDKEKHYCPRFCQVIKDTLAEAQPSEEDIHREREQAYMLGYEDASKKFRTEPCEDCISRQKALDCFEQTNTRQGAKHAIETLPPVTPERPNPDMIKRIKRKIDEMTEIHSDGEFYIKNLDAKWIISKYLCGAKERPKGRWIATENEEMNIDGYYCSCCDLTMETEERTKYCPNCGAEMSGGGEDEDRKSL